ncbi:MAG: acyltransferase [Phycisphaeraceae bacterium]
MPDTLRPIDYTKVHARVTDASQPGLRKYQAIVVGSDGLWATLRYELYTALAANAAGAMGLVLRRWLYPRLFYRSRPGLVVGRGVTLRHPGRIAVGRNVLISDGCILDARSTGIIGIRIEDDVSLGDRCCLRCKDGRIDIGHHVGIGAEAGLYAVAGNRLRIADDVMIGPKVYLGGSQYHTGRTDITIAEQGHAPRGGIDVGRGAWIGAGAIVLDGVKIGAHAIVAAGAVVTHDVEPYTVVAGVPARPLKDRREPEPTNAPV